MKYALGNMLNGAGGLNADQLALDLQFAADKTLTARKGPTPVFTRASSGTFVGSNGLIQSAGNNVARFDHDPVTLASRGLLIEESRTNILLQSEGLSTATWVKNNSTITGDTIASPDGLITADLLNEDSTLSIHSVQNNLTPSLTAGQSYTFSVFAKSGSHASFQIVLSTAVFGGGIFANFVLTGTGSVGTSSGVTASIQSYSSGWYRCSVTIASVSGGAGGAVVIAANNNNSSATRLPSYQGTGAQVVYLWGAQLEAGSFATSYIPTTTASVVRSADVCSITGGAFTGFWNNNEGSLFASGDARTTATGVATYVMANSGANTNQVSIYRNSTTNFYGVANSGSYTANIQFASSNGSFNKIAGSYATNDARSAANGTLGTPDSTVTVPTNLTRLNIGSAGMASTELANGCIAAIRYYRKPLSNAKLQALTV